MTQDNKDLAYSVLLLERQLESYQKLHAEEVEALWKTLAELKQRILSLGSSQDHAGPTPVGTADTPERRRRS